MHFGTIRLSNSGSISDANTLAYQCCRLQKSSNYLSTFQLRQRKRRLRLRTRWRRCRRSRCNGCRQRRPTTRRSSRSCCPSRPSGLPARECLTKPFQSFRPKRLIKFLSRLSSRHKPKPIGAKFPFSTFPSSSQSSSDGIWFYHRVPQPHASLLTRLAFRA